MSFQMLRDASLEFLESETPQLRIESWSNSGRTLQIRGFCETNLISYDHSTNADRSRAVDTFSIASVPLSLQVSPATAPVRRGECYVRITLLMGGFPVGRLISAYLTDGKTLSWPPGVQEGFTEEAGLIRVITGTDPSAGGEVSETVPTNTRWRLLGMNVAFTADANTADREPKLTLDDGSTVFAAIPLGVTITANVTLGFQYLNIGAPTFQGSVSTRATAPLPDISLLQGYRIRTVTTNQQVGDDYNAPVLTVEEWIEE